MKVSRASEVGADLRRRISSGEFQPGDRLPRLRELMDAYGIRSKSSLDRVLRELAGEGLVTIIHGSGIYVRRRHLVYRNLEAGLRAEHHHAMRGDATGEGIFEATTGAGDLTVDVSYEHGGADERVARGLAVKPGSPILIRTFRYFISGAPHQVARSHLPVATATEAGLADPDGEEPGVGTMHQLHRAGIDVDRVTVTLESRPPTAREASELAIPPGTSVYDHFRVMYSEGRPVEVSTAIVPGDRVAYVLDIDLSKDKS